MILNKFKNYFERPTIQRVHPINQTITAMKLQSNFIISITKEAEEDISETGKYPTDIKQM